jgi:hypothetical protein
MKKGRNNFLKMGMTSPIRQRKGGREYEKRGIFQQPLPGVFTGFNPIQYNNLYKLSLNKTLEVYLCR